VFKKLLGGPLISDDERRARRNSFAMFDALETIESLSSPIDDACPNGARDFSVSKLYMDTRSLISHRADYTTPITFFRRPILDSESNKDDDAYNTSPWFLAFSVRRIYRQTMGLGGTNEYDLEYSYPDGIVTAEIQYCLASDISNYQYSFFVKKKNSDALKLREKFGRDQRTLYGLFHPQSRRAFATDLYENMRNALKNMSEHLGSSISNAELASRINLENNKLRPRWLGPYPELTASIE
jgi:hypothetical protein